MFLKCFPIWTWTNGWEREKKKMNQEKRNIENHAQTHTHTHIKREINFEAPIVKYYIGWLEYQCEKNVAASILES